MEPWLIVIIIAYLFFALSSLCDKLVLAGDNNSVFKSLKPRSYTFYVGVFSLFALFIIPFINFGFPNAIGFFWIALCAFVHIVALYTMYVALTKFEVSKVIATIGATQPIFIFILTWLFWGNQSMQLTDILAFLLLFTGSIVISFSKNIKITADFLRITLFSSLMFAFDYIFLKFVFLNQPFLQGTVWISIFLFLFVLFFLFSKNARREIFSKQVVGNKKTQGFFLGAQVFGGVANLLQNLSIALATVAFLAIINSLRGIQYAFIFILALFFSLFLPKILKEELSKKIIIQKVVSIIVIGIGLALLII